VSVSCAKGYDCCVRFEVRTSWKTLCLSVVLRDMIAVKDMRPYLTENTVSVSCAKGYDCCVTSEVRTSRKTLCQSVVLRDMIAV
jgi:hypothetical protein